MKLITLQFTVVPDGLVIEGLEPGILEVSGECLKGFMRAVKQGYLYPYEARIVGKRNPDGIYFVEVYES